MHDEMAPKCHSQSSSPTPIEDSNGDKIKKNNNTSNNGKRNGIDGEDKSWWTWMENSMAIEEPGLFSPQHLCYRSSLDDAPKQESYTRSYDFAAMHAMLIESLLEEHKPTEGVGDQLSPNSSLIDSELDMDPVDGEIIPNRLDSIQNRTKSTLSDNSTASFIKKLKKNKRKRSRKRDNESSASIFISLPPTESIGNISTFSSVESSLSISTVDSFLPSPGSFLASDCRLQKDKGNGVEPGTAITCYGREASLEKLRRKTAILGQAISGDEKKFSKNDSDSDTSFRRPWGVLKPTAKAEMRRGPVKLTKLNPPETRSILEVKMGFLSLKYGILFQWNKIEGLVELVVMRKMVTGAFMDVEAIDVSKYKRKSINNSPNHTRKSTQIDKNGLPPTAPLPDLPPTPSDYDGDDSVQTMPTHRGHNNSQSFAGNVDEINIQKISLNSDESLEAQDEKPLPSDTKRENSTSGKNLQTTPPPPPRLPDETSYTIRNIISGARGSNAIVEKTNNYEAENVDNYIEPPYLVRRPKKFKQSKITVTVLRARGLMRKRKQGNTYVQVSTKSQMHRTGVIKMSKNPVWGVHDKNCCTLGVDEELDDVLKVEICERRQLHKDRTLSVLYVPLELVEPRRVAGEPTEITIPCRMFDKNGPYGSITLALAYESPYRYWMRKEIQAREKKENGEIEVSENADQWTTYWFCCYC